MHGRAKARRVEGGSGRAAAPGARPLGSRVPGPRCAASLSALARFCPLFVSLCLPICRSPSLCSSLSSSGPVPFCLSVLSFPGFVLLFSAFPFFPSVGSLCVCAAPLLPTLTLRQPPAWSRRNSFLDWVQETKPSPYLPPAPGHGLGRPPGTEPGAGEPAFPGVSFLESSTPARRPGQQGPCCRPPARLLPGWGDSDLLQAAVKGQLPALAWPGAWRATREKGTFSGFLRSSPSGRTPACN